MLRKLLTRMFPALTLLPLTFTRGYVGHAQMLLTVVAVCVHMFFIRMKREKGNVLE